MKQLVEYPMEGGDTVIIEVETDVDVDVDAGRQPAGLADKAVETAHATFEAAIATVRKTAGAIVRTVRDVADPPDEITVEFGLKMNLTGEAFIASATAEANFKIAVKWIAPE